jgi:type I restriction enzyme S subunit
MAKRETRKVSAAKPAKSHGQRPLGYESATLPNGWAPARIGDVTIPKVEQTEPEGREFRYIDIGSVDNRTKQITEANLLPVAKAPSRARQRVKTNDVLVSLTRPNLNAVALVPARLDGATASTGFDVLRGHGALPEWLMAVVKSAHFVETMSALVQGALYPAVRPADVRAYHISLPPLAEQKRIVARLAGYESRLQNVREALAEIQQLLAQARQSLLAAAFQGTLTADWRESHTAQPLLPEVEAERRRRWETAELKRLKAKDQEPEDDRWRENYPSVEPLSEAENGESAQGCEWACLDQLCDAERTICYGVVQLGTAVAKGVPCLRTSDLKPLALLTDNVKRISKPLSEQYGRTVLKGGEILVSVRGTLGGIAVAPPNVRGWNISREVAMVPVLPPIEPEYLARMIAAPQSQTWLTKAIKGVAYTGINITDLKRLPVPIAPLAEQREVIRRLTTAFARLDSASAAHSEALSELDRVERSLLAQAFRGELEPQDPTDEPAAQLLDRVRLERATAPIPPKKKPNKVTMKPLTTESIKDTIQKMPEDRFSFDDLRGVVSGSYDEVKDLVFSLLAETKPSLKQVFDTKAQTMRFQRVKQ